MTTRRVRTSILFYLIKTGIYFDLTQKGIEYLILKPTEECSFSGLDPTHGFDGINIGNAGVGAHYQIKDPNEFFFIDSSLVYSGQVSQSKILCLMA